MNGEHASLPRAAVVLDPHPLYHEGMRALLGPLGIAVVGACRAPATALSLLRERRPDVFVAEIDGPDGPSEGVECVRRARERHEDLAIVVVSSRVDPPLVDSVLAAGATRYVAKAAPIDEIADAVRRAIAPAIYLVSEAGTPLEGVEGVVDTLPSSVDERGARLTRRELEVLQLVEGRSNRQVAQLLWVTDETVKFHLANIYRKLGVSSRAEAVGWARRNGLLEPADAYAVTGARVPIAGAWGS